MQSVAIRWQSVDGQRLGGVYNQRRQSEAIGGNQCQSDVIIGNQMQSKAISSQAASLRIAGSFIKGNQSQSEAI